MQEKKLFSPVKIGNLTLDNRVAMAPLTRQKAGERLVPTWLSKIYYGQRATAGLIVSEATVISKQGVGYPSTPGIFSDEQVEGWKPITEAVHANGGRIYCQLWHCGRSSHPDFHNGDLPVSAGDVSPGGTARTYNGERTRVAPRALRTEEIEGIIQDYVNAAENAIKAGFDGVEIHGANGYLIDQFICDGSNTRTDEYGGPIENRIKFANEVVGAVVAAIGNEKTAIRLSPSGTFNGMSDSTPKETFSALVKSLNKYNLSYLHIMEPFSPPGKNFAPPERYLQDREVTPFFRKIYDGILMTNSGYSAKDGVDIVENGVADMVAYGKDYISNPDLVRRIKENLELTKWDSSTFYGGDDRGFIDYPFYGE